MKDEPLTLQDLFDKSLAYAEAKLAAKEGFSLVGCCRSEDDSLNGARINAVDDEDMVEKAKDILRRFNARAFVFVGEGTVLRGGTKKFSILGGTKKFSILIVYLQDEDWPEVRRVIFPYSMDRSGKLRPESEVSNSLIGESWLP